MIRDFLRKNIPKLVGMFFYIMSVSEHDHQANIHNIWSLTFFTRKRFICSFKTSLHLKNTTIAEIKERFFRSSKNADYVQMNRPQIGQNVLVEGNDFCGYTSSKVVALGQIYNN